jgi:hypothetical protein
MLADDDNEQEKFEPDYSKYKTDVQVNECVREFAHDIIHSAQLQNKEIKVSIDFDTAINSDQTLIAAKARINSDLGTIMVFPNFGKKSSSAYILNRGMINRMRKEGFSEEFIQRNGGIYSDQFNFTQKNVKMLGYYLTHKINHDNEKS